MAKVNYLDAVNQDSIMVIAEFPDIDYTLIHRGTSYEPWVAAYGFNKETETWAQGHYFNDINKAMRWIENKIDVIPFPRMSEIASKAIDGLFEDDPYEAKIYCEDTLELTEEENEYFGISEKEEEELEW